MPQSAICLNSIRNSLIHPTPGRYLPVKRHSAEKVRQGSDRIMPLYLPRIRIPSRISYRMEIQ